MDGDVLAGSGGPSHDKSMEMRVQRLEDTLPGIERLMTSLDERLRKVAIPVAE